MENFLNFNIEKLEKCGSFDIFFINDLTDLSKYVLLDFFSNSYFYEVF